MKTIYEVHVHKNGTIEWFNSDGKNHRTDGPAIEWTNGHKEWFVDGKLHRTDGPAWEGSCGSKAWYVDGKRHRTDGPACEWSDGLKQWYIEGKHLSKEAFDAEIKKQNEKGEKDPCNDKIIEIDGKKYRLTLV